MILIHARLSKMKKLLLMMGILGIFLTMLLLTFVRHAHTYLKQEPGFIAKGTLEMPAFNNDWSLKPFRSELVQASIVAPDVSRMVDVPFARLKAQNVTGTIAVDVRTGRSKLRLDTARQLSFPTPGVPVALQETGKDHFAIVFRNIPGNALQLIDWNVKTGSTQAIPIERTGVDYLLFRGATTVGASLYLVVYDNHSEKNFLRHYHRTNAAFYLAAKEVTLPTLEPPAGTHYEMEPPIMLFGERKGVRVIGGSLDALVNHQQITERRIFDCERVLEAVNTPTGVVVLCNRKHADEAGVYSVQYIGSGEQTIIPLKNGIPWKLTWNSQRKHIEYQLGTNARSYTEILAYDIERGQNGGMLEFGSNNIEGRVPWSQVYYLNGFMDMLYLAKHDDKAFDIVAPLMTKIRLRLELEIRLLDRLLVSPIGMQTKAFTHDRSLALFAVQTSRVLLLLNRYQKEFPDTAPLATSLSRLRQQVSQLDGHMEVLVSSGEAKTWLAPGQRYLKWPRGNAFHFDGLPVPYNHQNEWAYSLFESYRHLDSSFDSPALEPQREIVRHFLRHLAPNGEFPTPDHWNYWWGQAFDGYGKAADISVNTPDYPGDKSLAWISFRTIDFMSILSSLDFIRDIDSDKLLRSAADRVKLGEVYPFASRSLVDRGLKPQLNVMIAHKYARSGSPWELSNQSWALAMLPFAPEIEDQHSK